MGILELCIILAYLAVYRGGVGTYCAITNTDPPWVRNRREKAAGREKAADRRTEATQSHRTMRGFLGRLWGNLWEDAIRAQADRREERQAWNLNDGPRPPLLRRVANWWDQLRHAADQEPNRPAVGDEPTSGDQPVGEPVGEPARTAWGYCPRLVKQSDGVELSCGARYTFEWINAGDGGYTRSVLDCGRHDSPPTPVPVTPEPADQPVEPPGDRDWNPPTPVLTEADYHVAGCPWIPPSTRRVCGQPLYANTPYCADHGVIGRLTECQWASGNPDIPPCPNERVRHKPFCEQHEAELDARDAVAAQRNRERPGMRDDTELKFPKPLPAPTTASASSTTPLATVTPIRTTNREDSPVSTPNTPTATIEVATVQTVEGFAASVIKSGSQEWPATLEQARTDITASGLNNDPAVLAAISQMDEAAAQLAAAGQALDAALANGHKQTAEQVSGMGGRAADKTTTYQNQ